MNLKFHFGKYYQFITKENKHLLKTFWPQLDTFLEARQRIDPEKNIFACQFRRNTFIKKHF